jgi:glycosyltransferase involved in cell wall biosynthesis
MKIVIIGNMNNMYFSLARYLIDEGYDCQLLIFDFEPVHFHPSFDTFNNHYEPYIRKLTWGDPAGFLNTDKAIVKADLDQYDFLIGSGSAPAFVTRIGRKLDIFIPYGEDLYALPFFKIVHPFRFIPYLALSHYQRKGIQNASYMLFDKANTAFESIISKLKMDGVRITCPPPLFYHKEYDGELCARQSENPHLPKLRELREKNDILILQHTRQFWKKARDKWNLKGNDLLIKGYAEFLQMNPFVKSNLILFEYGIHVDDTKKLIKELGIENHVTWLPKMPRKYLVSVIKITDLVVGELYHSWLTYCVVLETISMAKPLMQKRTDSEFLVAYTELYPMLHAASPASVREGFEEVLKNNKKVKEMGVKAKEWFMKYCVERPLATIINIIREKEMKDNNKFIKSSGG